MDFGQLFTLIPDILELFIPGYILVKLYRIFFPQKSEGFESTTVCSVIISYIINLFVKLCFNDKYTVYISIILSVIIALLFVKIKNTEKYKKCMKWIGKVSGSDNIWQDIFDKNKGSRIRCFSRYNHEDVIIEGKVKYFESCDDGECIIALIDYTIIYQDGEKYKLNKRSDMPVMYLNSRNCHGMEITYGIDD